jgi:hypothetical protein
LLRLLLRQQTIQPRQQCHRQGSAPLPLPHLQLIRQRQQWMRPGHSSLQYLPKNRRQRQ